MLNKNTLSYREQQCSIITISTDVNMFKKKKVYPDGRYYKGGLVNEIPNHKGTFHHSEGSRIEGDFVDGKMQ